jgi:hypothetical protein
MFLSVLAAVLALSAPPTDLSDLKPEDRADLQCLTVTVFAISVIEDPAARASVIAGATFYYGRLQGRSPGTDWLERFAAYARTEPLDEVEANRARCAEEIRVMGQTFIATGASLSGG